MKQVSLLIFICFNRILFSQTIGGYVVNDRLISAVHPYGCVSSYVTGFPDDSIWVNFDDGDVMTGIFQNSRADLAGVDIIFETGYHPVNYTIKLLLTTGLYSDSYSAYEADWLFVNYIDWTHLFPFCLEGMQNSGQYILPLDFNTNFNLTSTDNVKGIHITFLETGGAPDFAGAYIVSDDPCSNSAINENVECDQLFEVPNVFSPNEDGNNDVFKVITINKLNLKEFNILNRWGQQVFTSDDVNIGWDGYHNGQLCSEGVYFWTAILLDEDFEVIEKHGFFQLVK